METMKKEWKEFYRSSFWVMTVLLVFVSVGFILFQYRGMDVSVSFRTGLIPVFQTSLYFLPLLAMVYGAFGMVGEQTQRTLPMILARGIRVEQFIGKKFIALLSVFVPIVVASYLLAVLPAKWVFGQLVLREYAIFLLAMMLLSAIFLAIGMVLGTFFHQKIQLIGAVIAVWLGLIYLFDLLLMYWLPSVGLDQVFVFSLVYFLSPVHAVQYFLFVELNVYQLSNLSVVYEQMTFQSPWLVLFVNAALWMGACVIGAIYAWKRKDVMHD